MTEHPIYAGDMSLTMMDRPCAAPASEFGSCDEAAHSIGVNSQSSWTKPARNQYGWVCSAHSRVILQQRDPERLAAFSGQLAEEGREFWTDYGIESSETSHVSRRMSELDSLNSDTR